MNRLAVVWLIHFTGVTAIAQNHNRAEQFYSDALQAYEQNIYQEAVALADEALHHFHAEPDVEGIIKSMYLKGECLANLSQCDTAVAVIQRSLLLAEKNFPAHHALIADGFYFLSRAHGGCARRTDEAIALMHRSMAIKRELYGADSKEIAFDYNFMGYYYRNIEKPDSAFYYLNKALAIRESELPPDDIEISHTLYFLAKAYEGTGNLSEALKLHQRAYTIRKKHFVRENATISNSLEALGTVYQRMGNYERALDYYRHALEIRKRTLGDEHPNVANSYYNIGSLYNTMTDYHSALQYYREGNRMIGKTLGQSNDILATYVAATARLYALLGDAIQGAITVAEAKALADRLPEGHTYRGIIYAFIGEYYSITGDDIAQGRYFTQAVSIFREAYGPGSIREADVLVRMAQASVKSTRYDEALQFYRTAISTYRKKLGNGNPKVASVQHDIGKVLALQGKESDALASYQRALTTLARQSMDSTDISINPDPDRVESKSLALAVAENKMRALVACGRQQNDPALLHHASATGEFAMQLVALLLHELLDESAKIDLRERSTAIYAMAMELAFLRYSSTKDESDSEAAFSIAERSKAVLLLENLRDHDAKTLGGVPDSLIRMENDLKIELAYNKSLVYTAKREGRQELMAGLERNIFELEQAHEQLKQRFKEKFPSYHALKDNGRPLSIKEVKELADNGRTAIASFFVADTSVFILSVTGGDIQFNRIALNAKFRKMVADFQRSVTDLQFVINHAHEADLLFSNSATRLYQWLLEPVFRHAGNQIDKLVIIPDGDLAQLNFGILLTEERAGPAPRKMPYLMNRCDISYAYSASLLAQPLHRQRAFFQNFAGFAPSYGAMEPVGADSVSHAIAYTLTRTGNLPLPGAAQEVRSIAQLMKGKAWLNDEATETNFKLYAGNYSILHLAMHTLLNDEKPEYSELLFNKPGDPINDGFLKVSEIYNLQLKAELVVLSACSSGAGKIQTGEGAISISRAFSYAGCPSVVVSLWKVPDAVTARVMLYFYNELKRGKNKDEALRLAQIRFVNETDDPLHRHPYYWAGFVVMGDTAPISPGYVLPALAVGSAAVVMACFLMFTVSGRKKRRLPQALQ